ncbi:hypothetical protein Syun_022536 [Stephania yunnanensis]|uniref:Apple domain-containing protein n=1 Tax=Stephania yunnanensis TaxID=152371 RepID=A0AAP0F762_9MAGN
MRIRQRFNYSFIRNENESHFTYTAINKSLIGRLVIDVTGRIKTLIWNEGSQDWVLYWARPPMQCRVYNLCGAYGICRDDNLNSCDCLPGFEKGSPKDWDLLDYSGGCVRKMSLQCGNKTVFSKIPNTRLPTNNVTLRVEGADKCEEACSNNCSCNAYAYTSSTGCMTWYDSLFNLQQLGSGGDDLYLKLAPSNDSSSGRKNSVVVYVAVGAALGVTALVVILVLILCRLRMKRKARALGSADRFVFLTAFKYRHLKAATKNFSEKLGQGSFGSVFKGVLPDSTPIAVKKLTGVGQERSNFVAR